MSFNIRYGTADDGANSWPHRREWVVERIKAFDPDLLGLQECRDDEQAAYLKSRLASYQFLGVRRGGAGEPAIEMAPVLFRAYSFVQLDAGHFWLSTTPDQPKSISWGSTFPRTVTWVELRHRESGRCLTFFNTHFDYAGRAAQESAKLLRKHFDQLGPDKPIILTGDFNAEKDSLPYRALLAVAEAPSCKLLDALRQADPELAGAEGTSHDFGRAQNPPAIDWLLISDHFVTVEAAVDRTSSGQLYPSDHWPIHATVKLRPPLEAF
jgi:endonuclease/exonuclease/phosphatase family metal-dependent hydrolase